MAWFSLLRYHHARLLSSATWSELMQTCTSGRRTRCASARTSLADRRAIKLRGRGLGLKQLNVLLPVAIVARVTAQKVGQRTVGTSYQTFEQVSQSPSVTQCAIIRVVAPTADCTGPNFFIHQAYPNAALELRRIPAWWPTALRACTNKLLLFTPLVSPRPTLSCLYPRTKCSLTNRRSSLLKMRQSTPRAPQVIDRQVTMARRSTSIRTSLRHNVGVQCLRTGTYCGSLVLRLQHHGRAVVTCFGWRSRAERIEAS